jgi:hypothetical protein
MGRKPILSVASAVLAGIALSGCESGRGFYDGSRAYLPPPAPASMTYAQANGYYNQPRVGQPAMTAPPAVTSMKPEMPRTTTPVDVTSSLQLVNGTSVTPNPTPMLTITLPAVKFLVPINGTYSFTPPAGTVTPAVQTTDSAATTHSPSGPSMQPNVQYVLPTTSGAQATVQYAMPQPQPLSSTVQYTPMPTQPSTSKTTDEMAPGAKPSVMTPPAPSWPKTTSDDASSDTAVPPPPPIHRGHTGQNP